MIGRKEISLLKDNAIFIYTAAAGIVDQDALLEEAIKGRIRVILDTLEKEIPLNHIARKSLNILITPHIAGPSGERRRKLFGVVVNDFKRFFNGLEPLNKVPLEKLEIIA